MIKKKRERNRKSKMIVKEKSIKGKKDKKKQKE